MDGPPLPLSALDLEEDGARFGLLVGFRGDRDVLTLSRRRLIVVPVRKGGVRVAFLRSLIREDAFADEAVGLPLLLDVVVLAALFVLFILDKRLVDDVFGLLL